MADYHMGWDEVYIRLESMVEPGKRYWGIPRGGQYVAAATGQAVTDIGDAEGGRQGEGVGEIPVGAGKRSGLRR